MFPAEEYSSLWKYGGTFAAGYRGMRLAAFATYFLHLPFGVCLPTSMIP
jgi:hypothetical protein